MSDSSPQDPIPQSDAANEEPIDEAAALEQLRLFTRQSRRKDVQGLIPQRVAARILGVSEARVRALVKNQRIRLFRYPLLKMAGVSVRDVCEVLEERQERLAKRKKKASEE